MFGFLKKAVAAKGAARTESRPVCVSVSETGLVRKDNQDSLLADTARLVWCVADGMGGGAEGAKASGIVCGRVGRAAEGADGFLARMEAVERAIVGSNAEIFGYAQSRGYRQMGSTVAVLLIDDRDMGRGALCYIGDSRIYRIRRGMVKSLTRDHTVGVELGAIIDRTRVDEFKDRANPLAHVLTRAIGTMPVVSPDWHKVDVQPGDRYVLCSDGVHDVISDARLAVLAGYGPIEKAKDRLAAEVVKCGAPDNYTFVILEVPKGQ